MHTESIQSYVLTSTGINEPMYLKFTYRADDPFVITVEFPDPYQKWVIGRDLLATALIIPKEMHGDGDLKIQTDGEWVRVWLDTTDGTAQVQMIKMDLINFVDATVKIVGPEDEESAVASAELDDVLAMILSESKET